MAMTVRDLMTTVVETIQPETTVRQAVERLLSAGADEFFVTDAAGRLLGVLPDFELVKAELTGTAPDTLVGDVMCRWVPTLTPDAAIDEAAAMLRESRYRRVAVVQSGRLLGTMERRSLLEHSAAKQTGSPAAASLTLRAFGTLLECEADESTVDAAPRFLRLRRESPEPADAR